MNRSIAYTSSWLHTFILSCIFATAFVFILIFLQPFDTYGSDMSYKNLKLLGYSLCIILPIQALHILEEAWFRLTHRKWYLYQEFITLVLGFFFITFSAFFYNTLVVNSLTVNYHYIVGWALHFGLPFVPIFIPLWAYLRFRFSKITIKQTEGESGKMILIKGKSQQEEIQFQESDFILAQAQANYVDIFFLKEGELNKEMIRFTISGLIELIPSAQQIHRSYLVNPAMVIDIKGNTRKGSVLLKHIQQEISISPKHFVAVKKYLQNRTKSSF